MVFLSPLLQTGKLARKLYEQIRQEAASIRIQKRLRAHKARISYTKLQAAAVAIQTGLRTMAAQNDHQNRRRTKAAKIIQVINALDGTIYRNLTLAMHTENFGIFGIIRKVKLDGRVRN